MTPGRLMPALEALAGSPDGPMRLRELVLELAVRGQLVPQDPRNEPASAMLRAAREEQRRLYSAGEIKKPMNVRALASTDAPHAIPTTWEWVRLGDIVAVLDFIRQPVKKADREARIAGKPKSALFPYYGATQRAGWIDDYLFDEELVLLGEDGAPFFKNGKHVAYVVSGRFWVNNHAHALRMLAGVNRFLCHALNQCNYDGFVSGTTRLKLTQRKMVDLPIPLPPLGEQQRIVAKVDELMALIDRLEAARDSREATRVALRDAALAALRDADSAEEVEAAWQRIAERMDDLFTDPADVEPLRQTVLQLAVRGRLVRQDAEEEATIDLLRRVAADKAQLVAEKKVRKSKPLPPVAKEEAPFEVPRSWSWIRLGHCLADGPTNGWSPRSVDHDTGVRTLKLSATTRGHFDGRHFKFVEADLDDNSPLWLRPRDLLIQRSNTPQYVGIAAIFDGPERTFIYPDLMMRCRVSERLSVEFVHLALIAPYNRSWFSDKASGTSQSMVKVNQQTVRSTIIPFPPLAEQHRIVAKVEKLMGLLDRLEGKLTSLKTVHGEYAAAAIGSLDT
ncbi:MAG TPA: restriction endonuclease subunit S [Polyangiaceae bacterium LLY-WYZ-15_(1-7)]|mgnify:CR=1 FL=1|nr:restriction endonuclease subunit S [Polyangiaceae bacterium LLY-WYZ-15_(1-7)]HJL07758.1 restriction endonuclease subunit S [Polyangiaceae bacterium LLY-WYZ-15_(1-7)]HJL24079.1 restriction endonuclease subunit S [Polyangiaceae bacterium LLY-WYZ-15_(1-7)]HJL31103.1 restriction endonuclease subunit S [Polyangiaceae bacterium LLY-WYZ-15_(1-7)]HJL35112.1 restriction endonuclease subunit S [Polyangiaceae bacterium LLY-WYZ-15_(1-7)]